jgi:hypothetical protein
MRTRSSLDFMCARLDALASGEIAKSEDHRESDVQEDEIDDTLKAQQHAITEKLFEEWYTKILSTRQNTAPEIIPKRAGLYTPTETYRVSDLVPFTDRDGTIFPIDSIQEIIHRTNDHTKHCIEDRPIKTFETSSRTQSEIPVLPDGLHMFDVPYESIAEVQDEALLQIQLLFKKQLENRDPNILMYSARYNNNNVILFYDAVEQKRQPTFKGVIKILRNETPALAEYILIYCKQFMQLTGIDIDQLEKSNLTLVYYPRKAGLNPHIDSVVPFKGELGPILTIPMGTGVKMLDMLPSLEPTHHPVRTYSKPNQFTIMDGMARVTWSHGLPWYRDIEQWTVALKFPALSVAQKYTKLRVFTFNGTEISVDVPFHLQPRDIT